MFIPEVLVIMSQVIIESMWSSKIKTWLSLVHFFDTLCKWVGMGGSAKFKPSPATAPISISMLSRADLIKSLVLAGLSQCGWCQLKSPQRIGLVLSVFQPEGVMSVWVNVLSWLMMLFFLQLL